MPFLIMEYILITRTPKAVLYLLYKKKIFDLIRLRANPFTQGQAGSPIYRNPCSY